MKNFAIYDTATGHIIQTCTARDLEIARTAAPEDCEAVEVPDRLDNRRFYIADGAPVEMPEQPGPAHVFNWTSKEWEDPRTLQDLKAARWELIKQARDRAEAAPFTVPDIGAFDGDQASRDKISGACTAALVLSADFSTDWTLADNSVVTLNAEQMIGVGLTMLARINELHGMGRARRAAISAATTPEEIDAVEW